MPTKKKTTRASGLTLAQKRQIERRLQQRESELYAELRSQVSEREHYPAHAGEAPDAGDASVADLLTDVDNAEMGRDLRELRAVSAALRNVASENYGICMQCGSEIPFERLKAQPAAKRCVRCQAQFERVYPQYGAGPTL